MRISDWSSDVCSSDLLPWIELAPFASHGDDHQEWHAADIRQCQRVNDVADAAALQQQRAAPPTEPGAGEQAAALLFGRQRDERDLVVGDRKSVVSGKSVSVRVDIACLRLITKKQIT